MTTILADLRLGARLAAKSPGFAAAAVLTLALGVGANTAIFSVVHRVLLEPLPYRDAGGLVVPVTTNPARGIARGSVSYADYLDWRAQPGVFVHVAVFWGQSVDLGGGTEPERVVGLQASEDYFKTLGVAPALGRTFLEEEHRAGGPRAVILSHGLWTRRFAADPGVIGMPIRLAGQDHTVVGVLPAEPVWPSSAEFWRPLQFGPTAPDWVLRRDNCIFQAVARLAPGTTLREAQAFQDLMARRVSAEHPESSAGSGYGVIPLRDWIVGPDLRLALVVLLGAALLVLLIACVNVANLTLARGVARERELAVRLALGATRPRLIAQLLTEGLVLALAGGAAGVLSALWGVDLLLGLAPQNSAPARAAALGGSAWIDGPVLGFALCLSALTALASGLVPALHLSAGRLGEALREGRRAGADPARGRRARATLVAVEVAVCIVLLVGAGLLLRSLHGLSLVEPGFVPRGVLTLSINLPQSRYGDPAQVAAFYDRLLHEVRALPGVVDAAASSALPVGGGGFYLGRSFLAEGQPEPPAGTDRQAQWNVVTPEYFATMGIALVKGRLFEQRDGARGAPVMILDESMARALFGAEEPLGKRVRSWRDENVLREVVGVVRDVSYFDVSDQGRALVYVPHAQDAWRAMLLAVRTSADPRASVNAVSGTVRSLDPELAVADVSTMEEAVSASVAPTRFNGLLLGVFAGVALLLALVGLYGLVSYAAEQRAHEIGIRMALGAGRGDILRLVTGQGMRPAIAGALAGVAAAALLAHALTGLLFGVTATDPPILLTSPILLVAAALAATYLPARRATRVDPMTALRSE